MRISATHNSWNQTVLGIVLVGGDSLAASKSPQSFSDLDATQAKINFKIILACSHNVCFEKQLKKDNVFA